MGQTKRGKNKLDRARNRITVSEDLLVQTMSECWHGVGHWLEGEDEAAYLRLRNAAGLMKRQKNPKSPAFVYGYYGAILAQRGRASEKRGEVPLGALPHATEQQPKPPRTRSRCWSASPRRRSLERLTKRAIPPPTNATGTWRRSASISPSKERPTARRSRMA